MTDSNIHELKLLLDERHAQYNQPDFIEEDPIQIPHQFEEKADIEIAGFLTALIAWGKRSMIIKNANQLMDLMDRQPYQFVINANEKDWDRLANFKHRTFQPIDCITLIKSLKNVYTKHGGLEQIFSAGIAPTDIDVYHGLIHARNILTSIPDFPKRTHKHLANPAKGSAAKRINMFLRWMVRKDTRGVDFGIWKSISMSQLICPLDVHTGNVGRKLGILKRKQDNWKAASELTAFLRQLCPNDPVKYDFSLFGLGIYEDF